MAEGDQKPQKVYGASTFRLRNKKSVQRVQVEEVQGTEQCWSYENKLVIAWLDLVLIDTFFQHYF